MEADFFESTLEVGHGEVRQQNHRVFVHVLGEQPRVEMVQVQMRHIEVVAVTQGGPVQAAVVGEDEPGGEVRRVDPRVAQNASRCGVDPETGVSDAGDLHKSPSRE